MNLSNSIYHILEVSVRDLDGNPPANHSSLYLIIDIVNGATVETFLAPNEAIDYLISILRIKNANELHKNKILNSVATFYSMGVFVEKDGVKNIDSLRGLLPKNYAATLLQDSLAINNNFNLNSLINTTIQKFTILSSLKPL